MLIERYINGKPAGTDELDKFEIHNETISQAIREVSNRIEYSGYFGEGNKSEAGTEHGYTA